MAPKARKRLQIDISDELIKELEELGVSFGTATNSETVRRLIRYARWFVREQKAGNEIASVDKEGNVKKVVLLV